MNFEYIATEVIVGTIIGTGAIVVCIIKWSLISYDRAMKASIKQHSDELQKIAGLITTQEKELRRVEKDFLVFRAELPEKYQRREDAIRQEVLIIAKVDALAGKIDLLALRGHQE